MRENKISAMYLKRLQNLKLNFCNRPRCKREFKVGDDIVVSTNNSAYIHKIKRYCASCYEKMLY